MTLRSSWFTAGQRTRLAREGERPDALHLIARDPQAAGDLEPELAVRGVAQRPQIARGPGEPLLREASHAGLDVAGDAAALHAEDDQERGDEQRGRDQGDDQDLPAQAPRSHGVEHAFPP